MTKYKISSENAREFAKLAHESRRRNLEQAKAEKQAEEERLKALEQQAIADMKNARVPCYFERRLARVRVQLDRLDEMMLREENPQAIDRLAAAAARLAEQERIMDGRPLPGQLRPRATKPAKSDSEPILPE